MAYRPAKFLLIVLIIFLAVIRFASLDIDPPYFFAGYTQAHLTDPYHLAFAARNAVLFDDWNPFDYHRWDIFKYSLISGVSYIIFSVFGVSRVTANISGLLLNMGGLFLFIMSFTGYRTLRERGILTLLLLINGMLIFYGRLPFLENGLIFLSGLAFFIFMRFHEKNRGLFLTGFLIAIAALAGKLFGFILLAPVILSLLYKHRRKALMPSLITLAGTAAGVITYTLIFYGGNVSVMLDYYAEQTTGMYGAPFGFQSPLGFFRQLVTYGESGGLFGLSPFLTILTGIGLVLFYFTIKHFRDYDRDMLPLFFCAAWLICGFLGLMPFNYRPLRYTLFLFLPAAALQAYILSLLFEKKLAFKYHNRLIAVPLTFFVGWYLVMQILSWAGSAEMISISGESAMFLSALLSFLMAAVIFLLLGMRNRSVSRNIFAVVLIPLALGMTVRQGSLLYQGLVYPGTYLKDINREISQMVDKDAVLTGPYMPALTIDNNIKGVIYLFGLVNLEKEFFNKYPVSHLVADRSNLNLARKTYSFIGTGLILRSFRIRDAGIDLIRLPGNSTEMTLYEKGAAAYIEKDYDFMLACSERFWQQFPDNLPSKYAYFFALFLGNQHDRLLLEIQKFGQQYNDNFRAQLICKDFMDLLYRNSRDPQLSRLSNYYHQRARDINPTLD